MDETIIGLFKTEVINFMGPWKSVGQIEWETMAWVSWYNSERLHSAIGYAPPQEAEGAFYESLNQDQKAAQHLNTNPSSKLGAIHTEVAILKAQAVWTSEARSTDGIIYENVDAGSVTVFDAHRFVDG